MLRSTLVVANNVKSVDISQYTVHSVHYTVHNVQFTVYIIQSTVHIDSAHYTVEGTQCRVSCRHSIGDRVTIL